MFGNWKTKSTEFHFSLHRMSLTLFLIACFNQLIEWMMNNITKRNFAFCTWLLTIHCTLCSVEWKRERIEFVVAHFKTIKATGSLSYRQRGALVADFIPTPQFPLLHSVNLMCTLAFLTSTLMLSGRPKKSKFSVEERVFSAFLTILSSEQVVFWKWSERGWSRLLRKELELIWFLLFADF